VIKITQQGTAESSFKHAGLSLVHCILVTVWRGLKCCFPRTSSSNLAMKSTPRFFVACIVVGLLATVQGDFLILPLGTAGGNQESNLSSFSFSTTTAASTAWINFDAGNLFSGLTVAEPLLSPYINASLNLKPEFNFLKVSTSCFANKRG